MTRQAAKVSDRATVQASTAVEEEKKRADLTLNQVVAGAGAAATSAVLGSFFGATGTVAGAALGSVASTVATTLYKHSLDRTRDTIAARLQSRRGSAGADAPTTGADAPTTGADAPTTVLAVPRPRPPADQPTVHLSVAPDTRPSRRRMIVAAVVSVLVFAVGMIVVTGLEWAKGASLTTGQPGTSVGRVLSGGNETQRDRDSRTTERSVAPTTEPSASTEQTPGPSDESTPSPGASATTAPSTEDRDQESTRPTEESLEPSGARSAERSATPTPEITAPFDRND
jgi:hypothetical protein